MGYVPVGLGDTRTCEVMEAPRRPGAVYGEENRAADAQAVVDAVRNGEPIPPVPSTSSDNFRAWVGGWHDVKSNVERLIDRGDQVVALIHGSYRLSLDGQPLEALARLVVIDRGSRRLRNSSRILQFVCPRPRGKAADYSLPTPGSSRTQSARQQGRLRAGGFVRGGKGPSALPNIGARRAPAEARQECVACFAVCPAGNAPHYSLPVTVMDRTMSTHAERKRGGCVGWGGLGLAANPRSSAAPPGGVSVQCRGERSAQDA
jgi:hypothetical protein